MTAPADMPGAAPELLVVLWGYGPSPADQTEALLHRLIAEGGRHGFPRLGIVHPPARSAALAAALQARPAFAPCPEIATRAGPEPLPAVCDLLGPGDAAVMIAAGDRLVDINWLDLVVVHRAAGGTALGAACAGDRPPEHLPALALPALALLDRQVLAEGAGAPTLAGRLSDLAGAGRLAARAIRPADILTGEVPLRPPRPALFLDRDGTLNVNFGYVGDPARIILLPGAARAVKRANDRGFYVFLVTNQSGIGCGYYTEADARACNAALQRQLRAEGAHLDDMRYCADHPDAVEARHRRPSGWRKPAPGMLLDLMAHWPVRREYSAMIGDKPSDVAAGEAAGIRGLLYRGGSLGALVGPLLDPETAMG